MKTVLKPVPAPVEEHEPLDEICLRVKTLAAKLNAYIQGNGCSDRLKRKARQMMVEISK